MEVLVVVVFILFLMIYILDYRVDKLKKVIEEDHKQMDKLKEEIDILKCKVRG